MRNHKHHNEPHHVKSSQLYQRTNDSNLNKNHLMKSFQLYIEVVARWYERIKYNIHILNLKIEIDLEKSLVDIIDQLRSGM